MNSPQSDAMQRSAALPRCDRTGAWNALKNHYDTNGRGFDLRDAFDLVFNGVFCGHEVLIRRQQLVEGGIQGG